MQSRCDNQEVTKGQKARLIRIEGRSTTFRAGGSEFGQRRTSKVLYVPAGGALPAKRPLLGRLFDPPQDRISLIANRAQCVY
jgi:hypothetical protein